jgi:hypothetical protein
MTKSFKSFALLALPAAALLTAAVPAAAQTTATTDPVRNVRISVVDPRTGSELVVLNPNQEITLLPGEEVMLRTFEHNASRRLDRRTLPASFGFGPTQTPVEIVRSSPERGEVVVRLNDTPAGGRWHVGYRLGERVALSDPAMQLGRILIRVGGPGTTSITGAQGSSWHRPGFESPADAAITALYRGILLREPDSGAAGGRDDIARNGLEGVRRVAANVANSPESRGRIYDDRGVSNAQRLDAIYRELLGWSRADVGRERWEGDLAELDRGNIAGVVDAIVRSQQFRSRFGI